MKREATYNLQHRVPTFASDTFFTVTLPSLTYGLTKEQLVSSLLPPVVPPVATPVVTPVGARIDRLLSERQKMVLNTLAQGDLSSSEIMSAVNGIAANNLRRRYLRYLLDVGYIEYTLPDKPNSRLQKYRLTDQGRKFTAELDAKKGA